MPFDIRRAPDLAATRWTSTTGVWGARAPFAQGRSTGLGECLCYTRSRLRPCTRCAGELGSISPSIMPGKKGDNMVAVSNYITSAGPFDATRMIDAMRGVLASAGFGVSKAPVIQTFPLTWAWVFDAPNKVYQAQVTGSSPFVQAMSGLGPTTTNSPTSADSANLPSIGTIITFDDVAAPQGADLKTLLSALRTAKTTAARGSNATNGGQIQIRPYTKKTTSPVVKVAGMGLAALIGYYLIQGSTQGGTPGV